MSYIRDRHYFDVFVLGSKSANVPVKDQAAEIQTALRANIGLANRGKLNRGEMSRIQARLGKGWGLNPKISLATFFGDVDLPTFDEPVLLGAALKKLSLKYPDSTFVATDITKWGQYSVFVFRNGARTRLEDSLDTVMLRLQADTWGWGLLGTIVGSLPNGKVARALRDIGLISPTLRALDRFPGKLTRG